MKRTIGIAWFLVGVLAGVGVMFGLQRDVPHTFEKTVEDAQIRELREQVDSLERTVRDFTTQKPQVHRLADHRADLTPEP